MQRVPFPRGLWYLFALAAVTMLLGGCRNSSASITGPQVLSTLPQGWTPLTTGRDGWFREPTTLWTQINIDNDIVPEYLLYFTYDNGQIGAIIYDQQTGPAVATNPTPIPAPNQPASMYVPYQVEPSYWTRSDAPDTVGFIAPPYTQASSLILEQVERYPAGTQDQAGTANPEPGEGVPATNEAIIYGGSNVITVLWWRNPYNGYGIAQMEASGGLRADPRPAGSEILRPLERVVGQVPLRGLLERSVMCSEIRYTRTETGEPPDIVQPVYQSAVRYVESNGGIVFCMGAPSFPYYPEGVVLAYLRPTPAGATEAAAPSPNLLWSGLSDDQKAQMATTVDLNGPDVAGVPPLVVRDLRTPATIPLPENFRTAESSSITTNVCAEVVSEDGLTLRRLLFDLVYVSVAESGGVITPEHFSISNITDITNVFVNCALIIP